jgi:hypothetical protein
MSKILNIKDGALIEGYDSLAAVQWCTPSFLGSSACVSASAVKGQVTITISLNTPFGSVSKSFHFNTNVSFTWQPFGKFKITVSVTNLSDKDGVFSFDLGLNPCVDVPFLGWKCFNYSHHFVVPTILNGIENDIDDSQFSSLLALHAGGALSGSCTDCGDKPESSLLQGDIYNSYLNSQAQNSAAFPTVPVLTCAVTHIPVICATNQANVAAQNSAAFPTVPVLTCAVTHIPVICATQNAAAFPTVPVLTCAVTHIPVICATNQANVAAQNTAAFPTVPVLTCAVTHIPVICATNQADSNAFPTVPVVACTQITSIVDCGITN